MNSRIKTIGLLACIAILGMTPVRAQDSMEGSSAEDQVFFEKADSGRMYFYFDEHYFLVDRNCEFRKIDRLGRYDVAKKSFDGPFWDYGDEDRVLLEGNYTDGKKDGQFTAYFPNGNEQWSVLFENDKPSGSWTFKYPDGLPMLEIRYTDSDILVWNFWDRLGRQRVEAGEGRFEFPVRVEGYNEYGNTHINYQGQIKAGKPDGVWNLFYVYEEGGQDYVGMERFAEGKFQRGYDELEGSAYLTSRIQIGPSIYFGQAEGMVAKACTIDENQDFSRFILNKLDKVFEPYNGSNVKVGKLEMTAEVRSTGTLRKLEIVEGFEEKEIDKLLLAGLRSISYWIPSFSDGKYIDDTLHLEFEAELNPETDQVQFRNLIVKRDNGK